MGKFHNAEIYRKITPQEPDDDEPEYSPEEDWETGFSDWKYDRDDDRAVPVRHVRLFDECGRGR